MITVVGVVAGGGKEDDSFRLHGLDRLRHDAVLEERLVEIGDVVADHFAARIRERDDAVGEVLLAVEGGVEGQARAGRDIVDHLQHRPAFVGAAGGEVLKHLNGRWQASARLVRGRAAEIVEAVGEHADLDAGAGEARPAQSKRCLDLRRAGTAGVESRAGLRQRDDVVEMGQR